MDIVERKNEENLKHRKNVSGTIKKLILDENDPIPSFTPAIADTDLEITHTTSPPQTDLQRFYAGKNIFITGGTGKMGEKDTKEVAWLVTANFYSRGISSAKA